MNEAKFDDSVEVFDEHYGQMRGCVRRHVTQRNLNDTLGLMNAPPLRVLDMEGGAGYDADWLAAMGHRVVLIDSSDRQLAKAYGRPNLGQATIIQGDIETALKLYGQTKFDLVLSHGALLYQEKPKEYIEKLSRLVRPLGALSLLTAGKFGKLRRFAGDQAATDKLLLTGKYRNNLGRQAIAHLPAELSSMLNREGFSRQTWFGVKVECDEDTRQADDVPAFHRNRILSEELRLSRDARRRSEGQMLHFIAGRNT